MTRINGFIGRRNFLWLAGGSGLGVVATTVGGSLIKDTQETTIADVNSANPNPANPQQALTRLLAGNQRFVERKPQYPNQSRKRLQAVTQGQYPFATILGCADSRVPTEIIFDQGLGDLFVVRVAGNVASETAIGSLEYAASALGSQLIVVLGHKKCGAVAAAIKDEPLPGKIGDVIEDIKPALAAVNPKSEKNQEAGVIANIQYQAEKLLKKSLILAKLVRLGKIKIVGAIYDIDTGKVSIIRE
ncbi:carbonic anhydrase [Nostoc sp. CMAA1605]|uniref:carbonic anhydrase n=1 Tax=Nostoc sp. CMAA1605 TaxID=2055159 RepID=UPI001F34DB67|nr:carbonic anhydrase [Nostoc sp. CMAA1605]MCF4967778.1 carbonic anhydrase [Nostoc sp. CMAA1605]